MLDTNFCSRCGFLLTGTAELLATGGMSQSMSASEAKAPTARARGLRQGLFIFLLTFLIVPIIAIMTVAVNAQPYAVVLAAILLFVGGLLRMAYAMLLESTEPLAGDTAAGVPSSLGGRTASPAALPPQRQTPASAYAPPMAGNWRDTNDLQPNRSESATKLLNEDEQ
jgi:hypothetical protein